MGVQRTRNNSASSVQPDRATTAATDATEARPSADTSSSAQPLDEQKRLRWSRIRRAAGGANRAVIFLGVLVPLLGALGISVAVFQSSDSGKLLTPQLSLSDIGLSPNVDSNNGDKVDVTITNSGRQTAVITGASVSVLKIGTLNECFSAAGTGRLVPSRLTIKIPPNARVGQTYVSRDPHYAVAPGDAQRFLINVAGTDAALKYRGSGVIHLYEFALRVIGNRNVRTRPLGDIVVAVADNPDPSWYRTSAAAAFYHRRIPAGVTSCERRNRSVLDEFTGLNATTDQSLATSIREVS